MGIADLQGIAPLINKVAGLKKIDPFIVRIEFSRRARMYGIDTALKELKEQAGENVPKVTKLAGYLEQELYDVRHNVSRHQFGESFVGISWDRMNGDLRWNLKEAVLRTVGTYLEPNDKHFKFLAGQLEMLAIELKLLVATEIELARKEAQISPKDLVPYAQELELLVRQKVQKRQIVLPDWLKPENIQSGKVFEIDADLVHSGNWRKKVEKLVAACAVFRTNWQELYRVLAAQEVRRQLKEAKKA